MINMADKSSEEKLPSVVVSGLLFNSQGKIFLARGSGFLGKYGIPGGHVHYGEKLIDALIRELLEETGLKIVEAKSFRIGESIFDPSYKGGKEHFVFVDFICEYEGKVHLDGIELSDEIWISPSDALLRDDLTDSTKDTLLAFIKNQKDLFVNEEK